MWQTGTIDKLAEVFIIRNHDAVFIDGNIEDPRIIDARKDLLNEYHIVAELAQFADNGLASAFIDYEFHKGGSVSTSEITSSLLRIAEA